MTWSDRMKKQSAMSSMVRVFLSLAVMATVAAGCGDNEVGLTSDKDITRFTVLGVDGTITGTNIKVVLPMGSDLTQLTPTIVHTGAKVTPASGVVRDFTNPITYTVTATDHSTKDYLV